MDLLLRIYYYGPGLGCNLCTSHIEDTPRVSKLHAKWLPKRLCQENVVPTGWKWIATRKNWPTFSSSAVVSSKNCLEISRSFCAIQTFCSRGMKGFSQFSNNFDKTPSKSPWHNSLILILVNSRLANTLTIRTAAKSAAKINYRRLTEINSCSYGLSLLRAPTRSREGVRNKGSWLCSAWF